MAVYGSIWQPMAVYGSNGRVNKYVKVHGKTMTIKMSTKTRHRMASRCIRYVRHLIYSVSKCVGKVCVCVSVNAASPPLQGYLSRGLYQNVGCIFWNQPLNCLKCKIGPWTSPRWHFCGDGAPPQKQIEQLTFGISSKKCDGSGCP